MQYRAFTLIELLVVMAIIATLTGMLMIMMGVAQKQGRVTNTRATMMKVDQAIRLFRTDMRVYPWQSDLGTAPAEPAQWGNNLAFRLAWDPPAAGSGTSTDPDRATYIASFQADLAAIQAKFRFVDGTNVPPSGDRSEGTHAFRNEVPSSASRTNLMLAPGTLSFTETQIWKNNGWTMGSEQFMPGWPGTNPTANKINDCTSHAQALTAYAQEITALVYTAGQMPVLAPTGVDPALPEDKARHPREDERYASLPAAQGSTQMFRYVPYNKAGTVADDARGPVLTSTQAKAAGWRSDYLSHAITVRSANGGRLDVDAAGTAIVDAWGNPLIYVCAVRPGVRGVMHGLTLTAWSGSMAERYNMTPQGRDATALLASDVRTTAGRAYVHEFELWSAGPDGRFAGMRSHRDNADNIPSQPYLRGMQ